MSHSRGDEKKERSVKGGTGIKLFRVALRAFFSPALTLVKIQSDQISIIRTVGGNGSAFVLIYI